jgi:hypothetical protein
MWWDISYLPEGMLAFQEELRCMELITLHSNGRPYSSDNNIEIAFTALFKHQTYVFE